MIGTKLNAHTTASKLVKNYQQTVSNNNECERFEIIILCTYSLYITVVNMKYWLF